MKRLVLLGTLLAACGGSSGGGSTDGASDTDSLGGADAPEGADGGACVPSGAETCDRIDNDCNGLVDDIDEGGDGLYDCQQILIFGRAGQNPSSNFVAWLTSNGTDVTRVQTDLDGAPTLTAAALASAQVVIVDQLIREYTTDEANILADWVEAGGGLMTMTGYAYSGTDQTYPNSLLGPFGLSYGADIFGGAPTFSTHPLAEGVTSVTFSGGRDVMIAADGSGTYIATIDARNVGAVQEHGAGRVFVWGDEWVTFDSEWTSMPQIQVFWANSLGWLGRFI